MAPGAPLARPPRRPLLPAVLLASLALAGCAAPPPALEDHQGPAPLFSDEPWPEGRYDTSWYFSRPLREGPHALLPPEVARVPSPAGGSGVEVAVIRPDVDAPVPVLVVASPYYAPMTPENVVAEDFTPTTSYAQGMYLLFGKRFAPHGYAVALVGIRGTGGSGGCMDFNGHAERADVDAAITWLGTQPWSSGNVGMVGGSYDGTSQWEAASMGNPHLKTIVPIAAVNDLHSVLYRNGTTDGRGTGTALSTYYFYGFLDNNPANGRSVGDSVEGARCESAWRGFRSHLASSVSGARDAYWIERDLRPGVLERYNGSVFVVHGLADHVVIAAQSWPFVNALEARGVVVKHWVAQWGHAFPDRPGAGHEPRWDWGEVLLRWFDRWLKEDATVDLGPRVQAQDSEGRWRSEEAWPPHDAAPRAFALAPGRALVPADAASPAGEERVRLCPDATDGLVDAPAAAREAACVPGAWFRTEPLAEELRFAGLPLVHVTVTPQGPGGHLVARLLAELPDGAERVLARGQMDLRYADGTETPRPVEAGKPLVARMQLEPADAVVPKGGRLVLSLRMGSLEERLPSLPTFPLDVHAGGAGAGEEGGAAGMVTVLAFARGPDAFFDLPR